MPMKALFIKKHIMALIVLILVWGTIIHADTTAIQHADGKTVKDFLVRLGKQFPEEKQKLTGFSHRGRAITVKEATGAEGLHSLWIADINNDGKKEYFWTTEAKGSGHYDSFDVYQESAEGTLAKIDVPLESSKLPSNLADPPLIQENGITYLMFQSIRALNKESETIYSGANSNAAPGAAYLVTETIKYRWDRNAFTLISRKTSKARLK